MSQDKYALQQQNIASLHVHFWELVLNSVPEFC